MDTVQNFVTATASEIADALNAAGEYDAFHMRDLDGDDIAEIAVEIPSRGTRFMLVVKQHWEDE